MAQPDLWPGRTLIRVALGLGIGELVCHLEYSIGYIRSGPDSIATHAGIRYHTQPVGGLDLSILAGVILALGAAVAVICATHVSISYFLQPTGAVIVWGGTLGVVLVTTPEGSLVHSARRTVDLFTAHGVDGEALIEEIVTPATRTPGVARRNHVA